MDDEIFYRLPTFLYFTNFSNSMYLYNNNNNEDKEEELKNF